jgi:hypothetical protein
MSLICVVSLGMRSIYNDKLGNDTGAIEYHDKARVTNSTTGGSANMTASNMTSLTAIGNATKFQKYENSTNGIKMQNPSGWRKTSNSSIVQNATSISTYENRNYGILIRRWVDYTN